MRSLIKEKKGSLLDIIIWAISAFVIVLFLATWMYGMNLMTDKLIAIEKVEGTLNYTKAAEDTFGAVNTSLNSLRALSFMMIFALGVSIFISNFLVKAHPVFFVLYVFIIIVAIIFSAYISNQYESLMGNSAIGSTLQSFKGSSFIMLHLPTWTTVIGFVGAIFLFIGILRDRELGGGIM